MDFYTLFKISIFVWKFDLNLINGLVVQSTSSYFVGLSASPGAVFKWTY